MGAGQYYLLENRQPIGYDQILPDSGLLILKVNPDSVEGSGTITVMNANPDAPNFSEATFKLDRGNRNLFLDRDNDIAVIPLWLEGEKLGVLVTNREKSDDALKAAIGIHGILEHYLDPKNVKKNSLLKKCIESFKNLDFISSLESLENIYQSNL